MEPARAITRRYGTFPTVSSGHAKSDIQIAISQSRHFRFSGQDKMRLEAIVYSAESVSMVIYSVL